MSLLQPAAGAARPPLPGDNAGADRLFAARQPPPSDHWDGDRFFNPGVDTDKSLRDLWQWRQGRTPARWPERLPLRRATRPGTHPAPGTMRLTFVGHATVLVETDTCTILTDPMFSERASPLSFAGPRRVRPPGLALEDVPPVDLILLSHNHYDHMDLPSLRHFAARSGPLVVTGLGNGRTLRRAGIERVIELDWWESVPAMPGLSEVAVTYVPAQHWSSRTLFDRRRALWGGHVVRLRAGTLFFAGDSGYGPHFAEIGRRFPIDVALLPIGAYEPRWFMRAQHMNPEDAVMARADLGAPTSYGLHWGVFQLTDEALAAPVEALAAAREARGLADDAFAAPEVGDVVTWRAGPPPQTYPNRSAPGQSLSGDRAL